MPYVKTASGLLLWEGPRTDREELELFTRINNVKSFPSANSRSADLKKQRAGASQQEPPQEEAPRD